MNARPLPAAAGGIPVSGPAVTFAAGILVLAGLAALRLRAMHPGLLYPDGYQYLAMARGIGDHLTPVARLGPGGDTLAPSADAAAKPLFPALVALGEASGLSPVGSARTVAGLAAAAVAPLAGLVTLRLGGTRAGAVLAALLCLASPTLGFWLGFPGPDGLAVALALASAAALLSRRPALGGVLAGLAVTARPELVAVAVAAALAAGLSSRARFEAIRAATAGLATVAVVVGVIRPPLGGQPSLLVSAAAALGCLGAGGLVLAGRASTRATVATAAGLLGMLAFAIARSGGWESLSRRDWPLLALAATGLAVTTRRRESLRLATFVLLLAVAYWWKNPGSERYAAILLPALAIVAGLGIGRLKPVLFAGAAALALVAAIAASTPSVGRDEFATVAVRLAGAPPGPLVTAAPDAYGVLLPDRRVRVMRPGAAGLVLVDGAARAYEPDLRVVGTLVERIGVGDGFLRPDGRIDRAPALLYRGRVVAATFRRGTS